MFRYSRFWGIARRLNEEMQRTGQNVMDQSELQFAERDEYRQILTNGAVDDNLNAIVDIV